MSQMTRFEIYKEHIIANIHVKESITVDTSHVIVFTDSGLF